MIDMWKKLDTRSTPLVITRIDIEIIDPNTCAKKCNDFFPFMRSRSTLIVAAKPMVMNLREADVGFSAICGELRFCKFLINGGK